MGEETPINTNARLLGQVPTLGGIYKESETESKDEMNQQADSAQPIELGQLPGSDPDMKHKSNLVQPSDDFWYVKLGKSTLTDEDFVPTIKGSVESQFWESEVKLVDIIYSEYMAYLEKTNMLGLPAPKLSPTTEKCVEWEVDVTLNVDDMLNRDKPTTDDGQYCKLWEVTGSDLGYDSTIKFLTPGDQAQRNCQNFLEQTLDVPLDKPSIPARECRTELHRVQEWSNSLMTNTVEFKCGSQIQINTKDKGETSVRQIKLEQEASDNHSVASLKGGDIIQQI